MLLHRFLVTLFIMSIIVVATGLLFGFLILLVSYPIIGVILSFLLIFMVCWMLAGEAKY